MKSKNKQLFALVLSGFLVNGFSKVKAENDSDSSVFKPSFNVGVLAHTYVSMQQNGFGQSSATGSAGEWSAGATLYRARIMTEAHLSKRDYIFLETELASPLGTGADKAAGIKILDAQYDHYFCDQLAVSAGKMLVSHNRNGLQTAGSLMVNDFTYYQYPYNMSKDDPLQNDLGRDIGVNLNGGFSGNKLKYRIGAFAGRRSFEGQHSAPLRTVGRLEYNVMDIDKYSGTNLGEGKTITLAGGFDTQGSYMAAGGDLYVDYPSGSLGSVTFNSAFSYISGGNDPDGKYSFASMIPRQNVRLAELGYYFKSSKIQPWIRYEKQDINAENNQTGGMEVKDFNKLKSTTVFGAGINYFFNGYNTNLKLSYVSMTKGIEDGDRIARKTYGQIWVQLQLYLF
ncbi:MAG: hypothetical protein LBJ47_11000 [Tannerella sp.]|jgi:hypothetical protein|nr:hypothetical protein [Tannerella sp.]